MSVSSMWLVDVMDTLDEPFPIEPPEHVGVCRHGVGMVIRGGLNCTVCGYFVRKAAKADKEE